MFKGLYEVARRTYLVVALDPANFEKPYAKKLEGVSTVHKYTPPNLEGQARLAHDYSALTATVVNTAVPAVSYANWFSYQTADFIIQNREIQRSIRTTCWVFPGYRLRFVMDSGGDDQKIFAWMQQAKAEIVITARYLERLVEVYNPRLDRWESEHLKDLVDCVPWGVTYQTLFHHAGRTRLAQVKIEHGYRFDQERGLDVEDMCVQTLERMGRLFALVLLAAQFVFHMMKHWPAKAVLWLRKLGGKLGLTTDRNGPNILLRGLSAFWQTVATLS